MSDRKLLEDAARAAGIVFGSKRRAPAGDALYLGPDGGWWNPLTDDGDALRLAVRLSLAVSIVGASLHHQPHETIVLFDAADGTPSRLKQPHETDKFAATRRAITRAAAAMAPTPTEDAR